MSHGGNFRVVKIVDSERKTLKILLSSLDVCVFPSRRTYSRRLVNIFWNINWKQKNAQARI